jgi:hypothetical protein
MSSKSMLQEKIETEYLCFKKFMLENKKNPPLQNNNKKIKIISIKRWVLFTFFLINKELVE